MIVLLVMVRFVVNIVWWFRKDPDTSAIPILTAIGDLLGSILLLGVFILCYYMNDSSAAGVSVSDNVVSDHLSELLKATTTFSANTTSIIGY